ncbi:MAG: glycosyl transferase family 1 [Clostridiaceae bacterium BRH_c20a]|nr:MAG: glycosyl transferase family 1 [Clostridiaceae bacterium BRH_c20a]
MRIDILHQYFLKDNQAGGSRFNQFTKYWSKNHTINVYAGMVDYASGKKFEEYKGKLFVSERNNDGVLVNRVHVSSSYNKSFIGRLWAYFSFTVFSTIKMLFAKSGDVIVVTSPPLTVALTALVVKSIKRKPLVFEIRDLWPESAIDTGVLNNKFLISFSYWLEKEIYKKADIINVLTPAFKEVLITKKGVPEDKIIYIPNGADNDIMLPGPKMNRIREKYHLEDKFVILYTGAHGVANKLEQLVYAANELKSIEEIVFMFVGDGMEKEKLIQLTKSMALENIIFVNSVPKLEIVDYINASDLCTAVLQKNDTFKTVYPNKVFDYMSCKKPILVAIDGIARKLVVEDSRSGIFVEPENIQAISQTILELKNNPRKLAMMGENGCEYVVENFSRENLSRNYIEHLEQLILIQ